MKHHLYRLLASITLLLATACAPVVYETPHSGYPVIIEDSSPIIISKYPGHHDGQLRHRQLHARIERELGKRHKQVAHIYDGYGRPGDLLEVSLRGGYLWDQGRRVNYSPVSFMIAVGDIIRLPSSVLDIDLFIRYEFGRIAIDTDIFGRFNHTVAHLGYGKDWHKERRYRVDNNHVKGAEIVVKAVPSKKHKQLKKKSLKADVTVKDRRRYDHHGDTVTEKRRVRHDVKQVVTSKKKKIKKDDDTRTTKIIKRKMIKTDHAADTGHPKGVKVVISGKTHYRDGRDVQIKKRSLTLKDGETRQVRLPGRNGKKSRIPVTYRSGRVIVEYDPDKQSKEFRVNRKNKGAQGYDLTTKGRGYRNQINLRISSL